MAVSSANIRNFWRNNCTKRGKVMQNLFLGVDRGNLKVKEREREREGGGEEREREHNQKCTK